MNEYIIGMVFLWFINKKYEVLSIFFDFFDFIGNFFI